MSANMTVEEARKILGSIGEGISDTQIEGLIHLFSLFSKLTISQHIASKRNDIKAKNYTLYDYKTSNDNNYSKNEGKI